MHQFAYMINENHYARVAINLLHASDKVIDCRLQERVYRKKQRRATIFEKSPEHFLSTYLTAS